MSVLDNIIHFAPETDVILITGNYSTDSAVEAIRKGASDYLTKPVGVSLLRERVGKLLETARRRARASRLNAELVETCQFQGMVGSSPLMLEVFDRIRRAAPHFRTALVTGPTGTGKELVARALHRLSPVTSKALAVSNCSAIVETLFESELFGHVKGAFTGATADKVGFFEYAAGGTVFLDEIGDMPLDLQAKILRVLQEREVTRTGGNQSIPVDVRIVAATNQELMEKVRLKEFREDLFYRLNVVPINLVPLRERREDIPLLVQYFLNRVCVEMDVPLKQCTDEATALLSGYSWPGNVRELENAIKRAVILSSDPLLTTADFSGLESAPGIEKSGSQDASLEELVEIKLRSCLNGIEQLENGEIHSMVLEQVERPLIRIILEKTRWNQVKAADILGINRNTLRKKIGELGIELKRD